MKDEIYTPKYVQIQNDIIRQISNGSLKPGDRIPSETELAKSFEVSRITANAAIKELATRGLVERVRGKGTFVLPPKQVSQPNASQPMVFSSGIKIDPVTFAKGKKHRLLKSGIVRLDEQQKQRLQLGDESFVYEIIRCVESDGNIIELDYSYIPVSISGANLALQEIEDDCLHNFLKEYSDSNPRYVRIFINTQMPEDAKNLMRWSENLFVWDTYIYDSERPIAVTITVSVPQSNKPFITLEM